MFSYLNERKEIITERISSRKKELDEINYKLKEDERFIELLDSEKTAPFVEFTPKVITSGEKKKQESIKENIDRLKNKKQEIEAEINTLSIEEKSINDSIEKIKATIIGEKRTGVEELNKLLKSLQEKLQEIEDTLIRDPYKAGVLIRDLSAALRNNSL